MKTKKIEDIQGLLEKGLPFYLIAEYVKTSTQNVYEQFLKDGPETYPLYPKNNTTEYMFQNMFRVYIALKTETDKQKINLKTVSLTSILAKHLNESFILGCITISIAQEREKNTITYADGVSPVWKKIMPQLIHTKEIPSVSDIWNSLLKEYATGKRPIPENGYEPNEKHFIIEYMKTVFPEQFQPIVITSPMVDEITAMIYPIDNNRDKNILVEYFGLSGTVFSKEELSIKHDITITRIEQILDRKIRSLCGETVFLQPNSEELFMQYEKKKTAFNNFDKKLIVLLAEKKIGIPYLSEEKMRFLLTPVRELHNLETKTQLKLNGSYDYVWEVVKDSEKEFRNHNGFKSKTQGFLEVKALLNKHGFDFGFKIPGHIENILRFRNYLRSF